MNKVKVKLEEGKITNQFYISNCKTTHIEYLLMIEEEVFKPSDRFDYHQFWYLINRSKGLFKVLYFHNSVFGYFYFKLNKKDARIYSIAINPYLQRDGYGSSIIQWIEEYCRTANIFKLRLEVRTDNKCAINFYTKNGFEAYDKRLNYYADGCDAILMKKDLQCPRIGGKR